LESAVECVTGELIRSEQITGEEANQGNGEHYVAVIQPSMPKEREIEREECTEGANAHEREERAPMQRDEIDV